MIAWEFIEKEKPNFDLVTLTPPMIYGPLRHSIDSVKELNESNLRIYKLFINSKEDAELPPNGLHIYTDVRDIAHAHILAATIPEAGGQRFIVCEGQISSQEISDMLRKNIPELEGRTPKGTPGVKIDERLFTASSEKAGRVLGLTYRSKEETFVELAKQLLEIEAKEKA
jgi:nucleoside-diphosphate-sugar epimerase